MKKRSRILVLMMAGMLAAEPAQMVLAETTETVTGDITYGNEEKGNADDSVVAPPES